MSDDEAKEFARLFEQFSRAFNEGDLETAFAGVAPDVEWSFGTWIIDGGTMHGRDAVLAFYRQLREAGDWHLTATGVEDLGDGRMLVHQHGVWTGRTTGISGDQDSFVLVEAGPKGVQRVREFGTREEALAVLGSSSPAQDFLAVLRHSQEAFNRGDYEAAFAGLSEDVVWESGDWIVDGGVMQGRQAIVDFFERMPDAGDWIVHVQSVEALDDTTMLVHQRGRMSGRTTGISDEMDFVQLWEFGPNGVSRLREFRAREQALAEARSAS